MAPRLFLLRHGEALHNVPPEDHSIPDPCLTPKGELQALGVPSTYSVFFSSLNPTKTLIVTSPFHRCLQTTNLAFQSVLAPNSPNPIPLMILPQIQECGPEPCDTGAQLSQKQLAFPQPELDWSLCVEGWNDKTKGFYEAKEEAQVKRALWVRKWLREREEEAVIVVCHHGFLRRITKTPPLGALWPNAELREYDFADPTGQDPEADVVKVFNSIL